MGNVFRVVLIGIFEHTLQAITLCLSLTPELSGVTSANVTVLYTRCVKKSQSVFLGEPDSMAKNSPTIISPQRNAAIVILSSQPIRVTEAVQGPNCVTVRL